MIIGIVGDIGAGKSHYQMKHALEYANKRRKRLVFNFKIYHKAAVKYCHMRGLHWSQHILDTGKYQVLNCKNQDDVLRLLQIPQTVVCLDEAGIFFNARGFKDTPKDLLFDLCQSRKDGADLLWCAQFDSQVDKQFRMLTQFYVYCQGLSVWSNKIANMAFKWKSYHHFKASQYQEFAANPKIRNSILKTWWFAFANEIGPLNQADLQLFKAYDSFSRLDKVGDNLHQIPTSIAEQEYYDAYARQQKRRIKFSRNAEAWRKAIRYNPAYALSLTPRELRRLYQ